MDVVVIADTHLRSGIDSLDRRLIDAMTAADLIVHAGDIVTRPVLDELRAVGVVHAVLGNNDTGLADVLAVQLVLELDGVEIAVVHDSGPRAARDRRMARRFPSAGVVIFGHSHVPVNEAGLGGQLLFNPGSPTQRRSQPHRTYGRLLLEDGRVRKRTIEILD